MKEEGKREAESSMRERRGEEPTREGGRSEPVERRVPVADT